MHDATGLHGQLAHLPVVDEALVEGGLLVLDNILLGAYPDVLLLVQGKVVEDILCDNQSLSYETLAEN